MNTIRTKAAIRTLGFVGAALAGGTVGALILIGIGNYFGENAAMITFGAVILSYMTWLVYDYNVSQLEIEEKYFKK